MRVGWGRIAAPIGTGLAVLACLVALRAAVPGAFERARLAAFDAYQRYEPRPRGVSPVLVVDVDDESLRRLGQWPWPRDVLANLIARLQDLGASAVGLDVVFAEPDRVSPARLLPEWRKRFGYGPPADGSTVPDYDGQLADTFGRGRVVTGFGLLRDDNGQLPATLNGVAAVGGNPLDTIDRYAGSIPNLASLDTAADGHGFFTIASGADEVIRRLPMLAGLGDRVVPSLALEMLRVMQDADTAVVRTEREGGTVLGYTVHVGDVDLSLDAEGTYWLHHPPARSTPTIAAWRVLDPAEAPALAARVKGSAILVGTSAVGLVDLRPTPMTAFEPGVDLHADAIEQALSGRRVTRPSTAPGLEILVAIGLGLLGTALGALAPVRRAAAAMALLLAGLVAGAFHIFVAVGVLLDPTLPAAGLLVPFALASFVRHAAGERAAARLRSAFTHYLSPHIVTALARDPNRLKLGGEVREMTFLFTDLEGFTALTESIGAEALVELLNAYLDGLCSIAMEHGGTIDKIVGDALHLMFNAPLDQPDHAARAVACALALDRFAERFRGERAEVGLRFGATRIGVNTGPAVVGNFGGARRFDYTAHGDAINTAARLESANKVLGTRICVARSTVDRATAFRFRPVGTLMLKGRSTGLEAYEPLSGAPGGEQAGGSYATAFAKLAGGDEEGAREMLVLHAEAPLDPVLLLHARRIASGERSVRLAA